MACFICADGSGNDFIETKGAKRAGEERRHLHLLDAIDRNAVWPYLFFLLQVRFFAFVWLVILLYFVILLTIRYWKLYKPSAVLLIPYMLWTVFAVYLNYFTWLLNR